MNCIFGNISQRGLMGSVALACIATATPALAQTKSFDVPAQASGNGVAAFARQADIQLLISARDAKGRRTNAVKGVMTIEQGLARLLSGTGLSYNQNGPRTYAITATAQQSDAADNSETRADEIVVTAQKRVERSQDVPIAISVFSAKSLDEQKIESGGELLRGTPNVSFSKSNFASYNFAIRGIGTKALSVTTDPAVAISFNSMPLIRNRLFEQEYFDVDRIEVLRGPQGTLYGRNAPAGVVNMIPNLADPGRFEGNLKLEAGNFGTMRAVGMLNVPLTDTLAVRIAGARTQRDGYDFNTVTHRDVNDRNLWSARGSISWEPSDRFHASAIFEHFQEKDRRSRTGKQLCHRDPGPAIVGNTEPNAIDRNFLGQGCAPGSLYGDAAFEVPNGASLPAVQAASGIAGVLGFTPDFQGAFAIPFAADPFAGAAQSHDLRTIATTYDPKFRAKNDIAQLNLDFEIRDGLNFISQSGWSQDHYYSTQDYSRFESVPIFTDTSGASLIGFGPDFSLVPAYDLLPGGVFCDPQLGCSSGYLAADLNRSKSHQWSQEFRLQSSFDGPLNFNLGVNYLDFKIDEDYFVFNNVFTLIATSYYNRGGRLGAQPIDCAPGQTEPDPGGFPNCVYIDPNPIESINGDGHNYFRSRNVARTTSYAGFGEVYWQAADTLKITAGLRYTRDIKTTTPYPSQTLLSPGYLGGGFINSGYPALEDIKQKWGALTGRFVVDWKPQISFTDDSLVYASYSRGYKAGGTNSPGIGSNPEFLGFFDVDPRFRPEYVDAFEIGTKNMLAGRRLQLNATAFFYDYKDYQVSQIIDRATKNENFDAQTWGLELESIWRPTSRLRFNANLGLLGTRIGKGQRSIDVLDRTQGHDDWTLVKPWIQQASNCIAPTALVEQWLQYRNSNPSEAGVVNLGITGFCPFPATQSIGAGFKPGDFNSDVSGIVYDPLTYADVGQNPGRGFAADLGGNELPNAPHWTFNIGGQYTLPVGDWDLTLRGDCYRQGKSFARVYNTISDRLHSWDNANIAITLARADADRAYQLYVKNLFDDAPITDAFINSDDSGLTTNVFTLDPRIIGFSISKGF
jgi:outer membrane receptor protein involved in Fe transport